MGALIENSPKKHSKSRCGYGPRGTWCKHPLIFRFVGDFWFHVIFTWYVSTATMLRSKRLHLGTRSFLNIHVHELHILKEVLLDEKNSDFICAFKSNWSLILYERLLHIIVYASIYNFGNIQPNAIGQIAHFTKWEEIDRMKTWWVLSVW